MVKRIFGLFLVITALYGISAISARAGFAPEIPDGNCAFGIIKVEPQIPGEAFDFLKNVKGTETQITLFSEEKGDIDIEYATPRGTVTYTELPQDGWTLQDVQCFEFTAGVEFSQTGNSVTFT